MVGGIHRTISRARFGQNGSDSKVPQLPGTSLWKTSGRSAEPPVTRGFHPPDAFLFDDSRVSEARSSDPSLTARATRPVCSAASRVEPLPQNGSVGSGRGACLRPWGRQYRGERGGFVAPDNLCGPARAGDGAPWWRARYGEDGPCSGQRGWRCRFIVRRVTPCEKGMELQ